MAKLSQKSAGLKALRKLNNKSKARSISLESSNELNRIFSSEFEKSKKEADYREKNSRALIASLELKLHRR